MSSYKNQANTFSILNLELLHIKTESLEAKFYYFIKLLFSKFEQIFSIELIVNFLYYSRQK